MIKLQGIGASLGCIMGIAGLRRPLGITAEKKHIEDPDGEVENYRRVHREYLERLNQLSRQMPAADNPTAGIFEAYEEILRDDAFFSEVIRRTLEEQVNIDYVIEEEKQKIMTLFADMDDEYLRNRAADIANVCNELILGIQGKHSDFLISAPEGEKVIIFAEDLTPEDTMKIDKSRLGAFVTEKGGLTSHTVILAKTLGIPAVVGVAGLMKHVENGQRAVVYGDTGQVILMPGEDEAEACVKARERELRITEEYRKLKDQPAVTRDGVGVPVNINCGEMSETVDCSCCDGVGLFRTEFIYMSETQYPSEEKQYKIYRDMAEKMGQRKLIIRTLDIGGDKQASYMELPAEANPFLGYRAIRICLDQTAVFKTQLRAILRASAYGNVRIMFPMIVSLEELDSAKVVLREAMEELRGEGVAFNERIALGIMIETPAAVWISDVLARQVDFFSIGTNDLIQYTTATDRMNEKVQYLYECCNPAVLRSIYAVCQSAKRWNIEIGMCGEAASDPLLIPLWVAMGIDELSVVPSQVAPAKFIVAQTHKEAMQERLKRILDSGRIADIKAELAEG